MHPNKSFAWNDREEMLQFVSERAFAHIFVASGDARAVVHAPILVIDQDRVQFHVFRNNRGAPLLPNSSVLASVTALDGYQSANWYVSSNQVPTWHYQAVEIDGTARKLAEPELIEQLDRLSAVMEDRFSPDAPESEYLSVVSCSLFGQKRVNYYEAELTTNYEQRTTDYGLRTTDYGQVTK